jgi:flagellar motor switch protein FliG
MPLSGREKATIFLSILGADTSARVLRYLPDELADLIASGINHLPSPSPDALSEVLNDFQSYVALPPSEAAAPRPQLREKPQPTQPKRSYGVLMYERPQLKAVLVSMMPSDQRDDAFMSLSRDKARVQEIMGNLKPNPLRAKIEARLKEQFKEKLFN